MYIKTPAKLNERILYIVYALGFVNLFLIYLDSQDYCQICFAISVAVMISIFALILVIKRNSINTFFITNKLALLDKSIECIMYIAIILPFVIDMSSDWAYLIIGIIIALAIIRRRHFLKNLLLSGTFQIEKKENDNTIETHKLKLENQNLKYALLGVLVLSILFVELFDFNDYLNDKTNFFLLLQNLIFLYSNNIACCSC